MLTPIAQRYDHFLLGLEGCLWIQDKPTPRAGEAVAALRAAGKQVAFLTSDPRPSGEDVVRKLWGMGFQAAVREVVTVGGALQFSLAGRRFRTAVVIGSPALHRHVEDAGLRILNNSDLATRADVVVVGAHERFSYVELRVATQAVLRGAALVGADREATIAEADGRWPGTGALIAALEEATGVKAATVGKPDPQLFLTALDRLGDGRALVVGDRVDTDVEAGHAAGLDVAIVLTGEATSQEANAALAAERRPVAVAQTLGDLVLGSRV
jgi:HAD superfamily hydrolase (TIGR01450 family)